MKTCLLLLFLIPVLMFSQTRPLVGVIRWDAWQGPEDKVGIQVMKSLSPARWHYRLPFYSKIVSADSVVINGSLQEVTDEEIRYAARGGVDYFAFLLYDENHSLSNSLRNYLISPAKGMVRFTVIAQEGESVGRVVSYLQDANYQHLQDGRPLVYTFRQLNNPSFAKELKDSCLKAGIPVPYIVDLHWENNSPESDAFDAISDYWYDGKWGSPEGAPFRNMRDYAMDTWNTRLENKAHQVLLASLGNDGRPRIENPVSWNNDPEGLYGSFYLQPTMEEFSAHLKEAFDFIQAHKDYCEANTVLIYAWNENDEGGWLTPTLKQDGSVNTERIDALRRFLDTLDTATPTSPAQGVLEF